MPHLHGRVVYSLELHGHDPVGDQLARFTQDNPLLDAQRQVLATEFPRRRFETELSVTVGGLRAGKGTYYTGRQRPIGLGKITELQAARKLGLVNSFHLISTVFDRDHPDRDENTFVQVGADFTRPQAPEFPATATVYVNASGAFGDRHLDALVAGAWSTFLLLIEMAHVKAAHASWGDQLDDFHHPEAEDEPVAAFMLLDQRKVERLGGAHAAADSLGAMEWRPVQGDEGNEIVVQLGRRPEDTTGRRLAEIRSRLRSS